MSDEKIKKLETENQELKNLCIYLAVCYQANYDSFASSINYCTEVKKSVKPETYAIVQKIFMHFTTAQGFELRNFIEQLSVQKYDFKYTVAKLRKLFDIDIAKTTSLIKDKNFTDKATEKTINRIKKIWENA